MVSELPRTRPEMAAAILGATRPNSPEAIDAQGVDDLIVRLDEDHLAVVDVGVDRKLATCVN